MPQILDEAGDFLYSESGNVILDELGISTTVQLVEFRVFNTVVVSKSIAWNVSARVNKTNLVRFNDLETSHTLRSSLFYTLTSVAKSQNVYFRVGIDPAGPVIVSQGIGFNTKSAVNKIQNAQFNTETTMSRSSAQVNWNRHGNVNATLNLIEWQTLASVQKLASIAWELKTSVNKVASTKFNTIATRNTIEEISWTTFTSVSQSANVYYRFVNPAGPVLILNGIGFNTKQQVDVPMYIYLQDEAFNVIVDELNRNIQDESNIGLIRWNLGGQEDLKSDVRFNTLTSVPVTQGVAWQVGPWINSHIRQLAQERIDFIY